MLLRRLRAPGILNGFFLILALLLYLPGLAGTLLLAQSAFEHGGLALSLGLILPLAGLPVALSTLHLGRMLVTWLKKRQHNPQKTSAVSAAPRQTSSTSLNQ